MIRCNSSGRSRRRKGGEVVDRLAGSMIHNVITMVIYL